MNRQNLLHIGETLKKKRLSQKLSLKYVAEKTKISSSHLEAIEKGQVERFPVYTFLRGFILSYAKVLKIDEKSLKEELNALIMKEEKDSLPDSSSPTPSKDLDENTEKFIEKDIRLSPVILAISILFILGCILVFANILRSQKTKVIEGEEILEPEESQALIETQKNVKPAIKQKVQNQSPKKELPSNQLKDPSTPLDLNPEKPSDLEAVKPESKTPEEEKKSAEIKANPDSAQIEKSSLTLEIILKAGENVKLSYQIDKQEKQSTSLVKDQFKVLKATEKIFIESNQSDSIYVFQNGKNLGLFGKGGKKKQTFYLQAKTESKKR